MTRQEMIKKLVKIHDALMWESNDELTDHTKKWAYIFVDQALECLQKNEEYKNDETRTNRRNEA